MYEMSKLHEMSKPVFWGKYSKMLSAEFFTQSVLWHSIYITSYLFMFTFTSAFSDNYGFQYAKLAIKRKMSAQEKEIKLHNLYYYNVKGYFYSYIIHGLF